MIATLLREASKAADAMLAERRRAAIARAEGRTESPTGE